MMDPETLVSEANNCNQCGKCTSICPVSFGMEYSPAVFIRLLQLRRQEQIVNNELLWLCTGCGRCTSCCPRGIEVASILNNLRLWGEQSGKAENIRVQFNRLMLGSIRTKGRVAEANVLLQLNLSRFKARVYPVLKKGMGSAINKGIRDKRKIRRIFDFSREVMADD